MSAVEPVESPMPAQEPAPIVEHPPARGRTPTYRKRFLLAYLALAVIAGAAVAATILVRQATAPAPDEAWSSWRPNGTEASYPRQIAEHVSRRYRLPSGNTLVGILSGPPWVQSSEGRLPVQAVAIQNDPEGAPNDVRIVTVENGVMYVMCGLGDSCSIKEGRPSAARHRLLRREALELALYTFKYTPANSVIALLPPRIDTDPTGAQTITASALFFERNALDGELERPLRETLLSPNVPKVVQIDFDEGQLVERLTRKRLFTYEFQRTQQGGAIIVLAPVP